jgi:hypothetical protein
LNAASKPAIGSGSSSLLASYKTGQLSRPNNQQQARKTTGLLVTTHHLVISHLIIQPVRESKRIKQNNKKERKEQKKEENYITKGELEKAARAPSPPLSCSIT